jgi:alanine racemase
MFVADVDLRPVWADVDLGAVRANVAALRALVAPAEVLAVVKADGYGHGAVPIASAALDAGAAMLGVALVEEGVALREAGIDAPILVLSEPVPSAAGAVVDHALLPAVYTAAGIDALADAVAARAGARMAVHLKVDTGMHRVGCTIGEAPELAGAVASRAELELGSLWTHFAVADEPDRPETAAQLETFQRVVKACRAAGAAPRRLHAANSAGAIAFPESRFDLVRCGIAVYGIAPAPALAPLVDLRPAMAVKARITFVKRLEAGERLSYGLRYTMPSDGWVATIPVGYADGVPRALAHSGGEVLVRGRRHPIAGTITMDQLMIDLGDTIVDVGEEVVLLGPQGDECITAQEWADRLGTIAYEVVCDIGPRVPRRYIG